MKSKILIIGIACLMATGLFVFAGNRHETGNDTPGELPRAGTESISVLEDDGTPTADDPWDEMNKLVAAYEGSAGSSRKGVIKIIDDNNEQEKVIGQYNFEFRANKTASWYAVDSSQVIEQNGIRVFVDERSRMISLAGSQAAQQQVQMFDIKQFKKMMESYSARATVTESNGEKMLSIDSIQHPQIQGYRIYYNPGTYKINKILIGMSRVYSLGDTDTNSPASGEDEQSVQLYDYYLEMIFTASQLFYEKDGLEFNPLAKVVAISSKGVKLQPAYQQYQLVNLTDKPELP